MPGMQFFPDLPPAPAKHLGHKALNLSLFVARRIGKEILQVLMMTTMYIMAMLIILAVIIEFAPSANTHARPNPNRPAFPNSCGSLCTLTRFAYLLYIEHHGIQL